MKKLTLLLLVLALALTVLTAASCAGSSDTTEAPETSTEASETSTEATSEDTTSEETSVEETTTEPETTSTTAKSDPEVKPVTTVIDVQRAFKSQIFVSEEGQRLPYRIFLPANYDENVSYPVLLFLHGAGERGTDNKNQLNNVIQKLYNDKSSPFYQTVVVVPQCPSEHQWVDTPWSQGDYKQDNVPISRPLQAAVELMDFLLSEYSINPARQYVMGISMGGFGTWDLIMRYPERFAAAIPICGGGDRTKAPLLVNMPIWTFHDTKDGVVPVSGTKFMVNAIEKAGGTLITYTETSQYDHFVWDPAVETEGLFDWLFTQRKDKAE